jgi:1-aminocyclopropane-1-carboxylate deaminase
MKTKGKLFLLIYLNVSFLKINIPSPIEKINFRYTDDLSYSFHIKRDDLIHFLISGNKWRKLSNHMTSQNVQECAGVVTCGGPWSNHILAAACATHERQIPIIGFVRGDYHRYVNHVLLKSKRLGMDLRFLSNTDFDKFVKKPQKFLASRNLEQYLYIPMGGDDENGQIGCQTIVKEVNQQGCRPDIWLVSAGKGTTASGMLSALDYPCQVYIFPAVNQPDEIRLLEQKFKSISSPAIFHIMKPHRCRFGSIDEQFLDFIRAFYLQTDILLDPVYNGKMMEAFFEQSKHVLHSKSLMAYHSGGLFGWKGIEKRYEGRFDFTFLPVID